MKQNNATPGMKIFFLSTLSFLLSVSAFAEAPPMSDRVWQWYHHHHHPWDSPTPTPIPTPTPPPTPTPSPTDTPTPSPSPTETPTPTPPSGKRPPRGVAYLLAADQTISASQNCWSNDHVPIVRLRVSASSLEKTEGVYTWTALDTAAGLAAANGKQWTVGVQWTGTAMPTWVKAQTYPLSDGVSAAPWDPILIQAELDFIKAFAARYDGDPNLAAVIIGGIGTNPGFETYVSRSAHDTDILGGDGNDWIAGAQQIITAYATSFSGTPVIVAAAEPFPGDDTSLPALIDWGMSNYANFGVMASALRESSAVEYPPNGLVSTYAASHPCGFQFLHPTSNPDTGGNLAQVCAVGEQLLGAPGFIEAYPPDCDEVSNAATIDQVNIALGVE
ncbi:MAG: hypothetical protein H0X40_08300 [Chthoniobacterales bacterium]|nr:hypothetical protein [Chthoniobacterales bacterium]